MKRKSALVLAAVLLCTLLTSCDSGSYSRSEVVLGDAIVLRISASGAKSKTATDGMFALADEVFGDMDLSNDTSVLSRFNASKTTDAFEIGEHIFAVLELSAAACELSSGAFDITSYPLSKLWRVDTEGLHGLRPDPFDPVGTATDSLPDIAEVKETLKHVGMDKIDFFEEEGKYYLKKLDPETQIDLGGIAKGYFADKCVEKAKEYGLKSCLIDLSGNLYLYGKGIKGGGDWSVGIADPRPRLEIEEFRGYVAAVKSGGNRSYVTCGDYQRFYYCDLSGSAASEDDLIAVCHVIDPRNGLPVGISYSESGGYTAAGGAVCMSVVSGGASAMCDALSTAVTVLGIDEGARLLENSDFDGLIFTSPSSGSSKGKLAVVGEWEFISGYDGYSSDYERQSA